MSTRHYRNGDEPTREEGKTEDKAPNLTMPSRTRLGDSMMEESSNNMTSQEAISVLLRAAMTSEHHESSRPSTHGPAVDVHSTSRAPARIPSLNTAVLESFNLNSGSVNRAGGVVVDENFIRAALASQPVALREPSLTSAPSMISRSSLSPYSHLTGFTIEQLAALSATGLLQPPAAPPPAAPPPPPPGTASLQDSIALLSAILMQQSAPTRMSPLGGIDPALVSNLRRILPMQAGPLASSPAVAHVTSTAPYVVPSSLSGGPPGSNNEMAGLLASLLPSLYNSNNTGLLNSAAAIIQSLQRVQQNPVMATPGSGLLVHPSRVSSSTADSVSSAADPPTTNSSSNTGRSRILHVPSDDDLLSPYQCLVRKQIEVFQATQADIHASAQGRNRPIILGQVGIRCIHCGPLPIESRSRGAVYFPSTLMSTYQTAQNMANSHLLKDCRHIPKAIREDLIRVRLRENSESRNTRKSAFGGGRSFWARGLRTYHGVVETPDKRLRFENDTSGNT